MTKKTKLLPLLIAPFVLTSCGRVYKYAEHLDDYVFTMKYRQDFRILQLTDIHWNINSSTYESKKYMDKVLEEAYQHAGGKLDLVELTGDMFMLSNSYEVTDFVKYFEKKAEQYGFMYAAIWGNHDRHGLYHPNWLAKKFRKAKHCYYYEPNDDLYGRSNFIINLTEDGTKASAVKWQIANLDSGASFSESPMSPFRDYDYIRDDQVDWWKKEHDAAGAGVPGIAYYHIPQDENLKMWNAIHDNGATNKFKYFKLEDFADNGNEKYASNFIDVAIKNNLKGAFMGHAHNVDWTVEMTDSETGNSLVLGLGVKTGIELYYAHIDVHSQDPAMKEGYLSLGSHPELAENFDLIGASLVTIKDDANFGLEHLYLNERATNDLVSWVEF